MSTAPFSVGRGNTALGNPAVISSLRNGRNRALTTMSGLVVPDWSIDPAEGPGSNRSTRV